jgi:uncharacterized protein (TIGR02145 family)
MKKTILTIAAVAVAVVSAQAQIINAQPGKALIFSSVATAAGWGDVTYQWYRDGQPIAGATDTVYTLPGNLAHGQYVEFKRGAVSNICPGEVLYSNIYFISFCQTRIGSVCWAEANLDDFRTLAPRPDMYTKFFQWNKLMPYSAENPLTPAWESTANTSPTWTANPCPTGWRLPDRTEFQALHNSSSPAGGTWANAKGNAVAGRFYGPNHATCTLPNNMEGCVFLPTGGIRANDGNLYDKPGTGNYWSATESNSSSGYGLRLDQSTSNPNYNASKYYALYVRCVQ